MVPCDREINADAASTEEEGLVEELEEGDWLSERGSVHPFISIALYQLFNRII